MSQDLLSIILSVAILVVSATAHEVAHGIAADRLGDPTARLSGRLTLNPLVHLDPIGSIFVPLFLALIPGGIMFGWAKPVPYNPYNLRNARWGEALVAGAGPLTNLAIAIVAAIVVRSVGASLPMAAVSVLVSVLVVNVSLFLLNIIPVPPLDGSKVVAGVLPFSLRRSYLSIEQYGLALLFFVAFFVWPHVSPLVESIARFLLGA